MDKLHVDLLVSERVYILNNLDRNLDDLLDYLISKGIITEEHSDEINSKTKGNPRNRELLGILPKRGRRAFNEFLNALRESSMDDLYEYLWEKAVKMRLESLNQDDLKQLKDLKISSQGPAIDKAEEPVARWSGKSKGDRFEVKSEPRGYCLILNNEDFGNEKFNLRGYAADVISLKKMFEKFHYEVEVQHNKTATELSNAVKTFSRKPEHKLVDAAVLVILSHGGEGDTIFGVKGESVPYSKLVSYFNNDVCEHLMGKPKFMIIQACRGSIPDTGVALAGGVGWLEPTTSEIIRASATLPNYVAWLDGSGSVFIQALCKVFERDGHNTHVKDMLTRVAAEVKEKVVQYSDEKRKQWYECKQMPEDTSCLTKDFYLSTKEFSE